MTTPLEVPDLIDEDVRLRTPTAADVPVVTRLCQDPDIQRWTRVPSPYTEDDARHFLALSAEGLMERTAVHLLVADVTTNDVFGAVGMDLDFRDFSGEVGYWVAPDARGRGNATRAVRMLLDFAFRRLSIQYVKLHAATANPASNGVARRLGFTLEGTSRDAMLIGPTGDLTAPRGDANLWGLRPRELQ